MTGTPRPIEQRELETLSKFLVGIYKFEPSDFHADRHVLDWKYFFPRTGWQGGRSYVLERNSRIVAHGGVWPVRIHTPDGQIVDSLRIPDWAADPALPGIGVALFRKLIDMTTTSYAIGGAPVTRQILPRIGFRQMGKAVTYAAWLRPWQEFRARPRTGRAVLRLLHGLTHPLPDRSKSSRHWDVVAVNEFDVSLLPTLSGAKHPWAFCQRTIADLNYLLKYPASEMRGFVLQRRGVPGGYIVLGRSGWDMKVLDLFVNSDDVDDWKGACTAMTAAAKLDRKAARVRIFSTLPILSQALEWNGYWRQYEEPVFLYDPAKALGVAFPVNFQLFDGDGW